MVPLSLNIMTPFNVTMPYPDYKSEGVKRVKRHNHYVITLLCRIPITNQKVLNVLNVIIIMS